MQAQMKEDFLEFPDLLINIQAVKVEVWAIKNS